MDKVKTTLLETIRKESYMDPAQLKRLAEHKYKADDQSLMTSLVYHNFWDWWTTFYPLWLAPNLITLIGLIINTMASFILIWYSPDGAKEAPGWVYIICAVALFLYQTLDSTDGKQARRTQTSSPLGELVDHGIDSVIHTFLALYVCLSLSLGDTRGAVVQFWIVAMYMFYAAHWQTYSIGVLKFGKFDIVETQCLIMAILVLTGVFGTGFWFYEVLGMTLRRWFLTICTLIAIFVSSVVMYTTFTKGTGPGGRTVANTNVVAPGIPILLCLSVPAFSYFKSTSGVFDQHICLFCIAHGMAATKVIIRVILAHMSRSPVGLSDTILIGPLMVLTNAYLGIPISEYFILYLCLAYTFANLAHYAYDICGQICRYMKIETFRIPYPPPSANGHTAGGKFKDTH